MRPILLSATIAIICAPIRLAFPSARMYARGTELPQTMHFAPNRFTVPSGGPAPYRTSKRTIFTVRSTTGSTHASLPFLVESQKERTIGSCAPHAGLGHLTVRAHSQAMTVASPPPYFLGNCTLG